MSQSKAKEAVRARMAQKAKKKKVARRNHDATETLEPLPEKKGVTFACTR